MGGWVPGKAGHWSGGIGFYGSSVRSFVCLVCTGWPLFSFLFRFARGYLIEKSELTPSEKERIEQKEKLRYAASRHVRWHSTSRRRRNLSEPSLEREERKGEMRSSFLAVLPNVTLARTSCIAISIILGERS